MKTKQDLLDSLQDMHIAITLHEHAPLFTTEDALKLAVNIPGAHCKNLFLIDDKNRAWLVSTNVTAHAEKRVNLKQLASIIQAKKLRFAKPEKLYHYLGVTPGSVTPLGIINDTAHAVTMILDAHFLQHAQISMHPLENSATVTLLMPDFMRYIAAYEHHGFFIDFETMNVQEKF
ncbi:hypothetical protein CVU75_01900 [Candidatus Dependentiae bacterium HGW-Dependentiae-1]|nr:MAG: hypothetical protein CVU75_01900 [Candidatus Dependentiae bacterium HGW-Dependentiae-1]